MYTTCEHKWVNLDNCSHHDCALCMALQKSNLTVPAFQNFQTFDINLILNHIWRFGLSLYKSGWIFLQTAKRILIRINPKIWLFGACLKKNPPISCWTNVWWSLTHAHVISNPCNFLSSVEHKRYIHVVWRVAIFYANKINKSWSSCDPAEEKFVRKINGWMKEMKL